MAKHKHKATIDLDNIPSSAKRDSFLKEMEQRMADSWAKYDSPSFRKWLENLVYTESRFSPNTTNPYSGAKGYFLIMPLYYKGNQWDRIQSMFNSNFKLIILELTDLDILKLRNHNIDIYGLMAGAHLGGANGLLKDIRRMPDDPNDDYESRDDGNATIYDYMTSFSLGLPNGGYLFLEQMEDPNLRKAASLGDFVLWEAETVNNLDRLELAFSDYEQAFDLLFLQDNRGIVVSDFAEDEHPQIEGYDEGDPQKDIPLGETIIYGQKKKEYPQQREVSPLYLPYLMPQPALTPQKLLLVKDILNKFILSSFEQALADLERARKIESVSNFDQTFDQLMKDRDSDFLRFQSKMLGTKADGGYLKGLLSIEKLTIDKLKYIGILPEVRYDEGGDLDDKKPINWSDLSITDKAPWIRFLVSKGITSAKGMEDTYNKYVDGGDKQVLNWPALLSVPHHVVANPNWDNPIETFSPNDLQRMWPGIDVTLGYYAYNPYPGENTIMYNPNDKTVDQNTIALDGLHFMRDNETYRSFYNDLLQEIPKDPLLLFESLNDQTWDELLSRTLTGEILNKIQNNLGLTPEEKEYFYPAVDGYLRRLFAPDYMISKTPEDHGYAPKYTGNLDILDKTNAIRELMESYILPEVTVTPDGLANKWYGPIVNYANDIMLGYHAEGGPLSDYVSSRTSNLFGLGGKSGDEEVPFDVGADYASGSLLARNAILLLKNRGLTEEEAITMLNDVSYMDKLYKLHLDRMTGASLPISSEKKLSWEEASEIFDTANQEAERDARNTSPLSFLDFLNNIPLEDLLRNSKETSFILEPGRYERVRDNTSPTSELSLRIEDEMNQIMLERGHNDQYYVPYNDTDLVNGVPSNVLDSLSKYAGLTGTPPEEGIGLSRLETNFGKYPLFNFGNSTPLSGRALANSNYILNFGGIPAEYLIRNFQYHGKGKGNEGVLPKDFSIPPLLDGFLYYNSGYYNTGDPNHLSDVTRSGLEFLNTEEGRNYWNTTGQYWYDGTYRDLGDDDNGVTHTPHSLLERQHGSYPTYKGGLHSNGGSLMKNREYDLSLNLINDLIKQGYQIEYV